MFSVYMKKGGKSEKKSCLTLQVTLYLSFRIVGCPDDGHSIAVTDVMCSVILQL